MDSRRPNGSSRRLLLVAALILAAAVPALPAPPARASEPSVTSAETAATTTGARSSASWVTRLPTGPKGRLLGTLRYQAGGLVVPVRALDCWKGRWSLPRGSAWRFDCAGRNNLYLLAHVQHSFGPLARRFEQGRLRVGQRLRFTERDGRTHLFRVVWIRRTGADLRWRGQSMTKWVTNARSRPSLTLQTCLVSNRSQRLVIRADEIP